MKLNKEIFIPLLFFISTCQFFLTSNEKISAIIFLLLVSYSVLKGINLIYLIPYLLYSPLPAITGFPLFTIIVMISMFVNIFILKTWKYLQITRFDYYYYLINVLLLVFVTFSVVFNLTDVGIKYYVPYVLSLILLSLLFLSVNPNNIGSALYHIMLASSLALIYKAIYLYQGQESALNNVIMVGDIDWNTRTEYLLDGELVSRLLWIGQEPNYTAALHMFPALISLGFYLKKNSSKSSGGLIFITFIAFNIMQVVGTMSRSAFVILSLLIFLALVTSSSFGEKKNILILIIGVFFSSLLFLGDYVYARIYTIEDSIINNGASGRFDFWSMALDSWYDNPVLGIGVGGVYGVINDSAHNTYIQNLAEFGSLGLILFLLVYIFPMLKFKRRSSVSNCLFLGYLGLLLMCATITLQQVFYITFFGYFTIRALGLYEKTNT